MTDTVNVPTPFMVEQCRKLLQPLAGNEWPKVARKAYALMTAAAPKAETFDELKPNDIAAIIEQNADYDECGLYNASQLAEKIYRAFRECAQPEAQKGEPVYEEIGEEYDIAAHCVTLAECPAGLFFWNGLLGFKSEYGAMEPEYTSNGNLWRVGNRPDAYCAGSGEYFWGGAKTNDERANLIVYPISAETVAMVASHGQDALAHPAPANDELLEAAKALIPIARKDTRLGKAGDNLRKALNRLEDTIAKHKGPPTPCPAPASDELLEEERELDASDYDAIDRSLKYVGTVFAMHDLHEALTETMARMHTGYNWNADPYGITLKQGDAIRRYENLTAKHKGPQS